MIEMWDADHPNAWQQERNLHFRNDLREYALLGELNYRDSGGPPHETDGAFPVCGRRVHPRPRRARPLGQLATVAAARHRGQGWFEEVENYLTWGVAVPYGIGIKGTLGEAMSLQLEGRAKCGPITSTT